MTTATLDITSMISEGFNNMITSNIKPNFAMSLKDRSVAVKLSFTWFGVKKAVSDELKAEIAEELGANEDSFSFSKKIIGKHPAYSALTKLRGRIKKYWMDNTLPFPEKGVRLLKKERLSDFRYQVLNIWKEEMRDASQYLNGVLPEIKDERKSEMGGKLYDENDYPASFVGLFDVELSHPSIEFPDYLLEIDPEAYQEEYNRRVAQLEQAVRDGEQELITQLERQVTRLCENLEVKPDGKIKGFHQTSIDGLHSFFERFRTLSLGSNSKLDALVSEAQGVITGIDAKTLKSKEGLRNHVKAELERVGSKLEAMIINKPRRQIIRDTAPVAVQSEPDASSDHPSDTLGESSAA